MTEIPYVYPHSDLTPQIERGEVFFNDQAYSNIDIGSPLYFLIRTPPPPISIYAWLRISIQAGGLVTFYENPTVTTAGTPAMLWNANRQSPKTATMSLFSQPTIGAPGTELGTQNFSDAAGLEFAGLQAPIILAQNMDYYLTFAPKTNNNIANFLHVFWEKS